ncbi:MAG: ABC transporter substrate-binding protein [Chloroflexi bacterium]|nr:ABC transporter substrate-binding protein [Chloroflexota bacterium]
MRPIRAVRLRALSLALAVALATLALGAGCTESEDEAPAPGATTAPATLDADEGVPGVSDSRILFGQSAAFTGPAEGLGLEMRRGIEAAFHERNEAGGVHGRTLELTSLDDAYETDFAFANTRRLIFRDQVFALIGEVGTPTSRAASPVAHDAGVPFIAPFTGAEFLRDPDLDNVLNLRASYYQETEEMVARLTDELGVTRVAVLYQNDSFGQSGLDGATAALARRGLEPVASWFYPRNTDAVKMAVLEIADARPEAVIMVGAYRPVAKAIVLLRERIDPVFMVISFVGSNALAEELGRAGAGVYITQVVPQPDDDSIPVVAAYQQALAASDPDATPGFVSLEGYLAGGWRSRGSSSAVPTWTASASSTPFATRGPWTSAACCSSSGRTITRGRMGCS